MTNFLARHTKHEKTRLSSVSLTEQFLAAGRKSFSPCPMIMSYGVFAVLAVFSGEPALSPDLPPPGIWTNTEDAYFAGEEGREEADWVGIEINENGQWRNIDPFAQPISDWSANDIAGLTYQNESGWAINGSELRQARMFACWMAVRKFDPDENGEEQWTFQRAMPIFDQGGRVFIDGGTQAPDVTIRMRNVTWAEGSTNNPVTVLYVHRDDPVRAESYSWASPDSAIVGINLRWVQGGCNLIGDAGQPEDIRR